MSIRPISVLSFRQLLSQLLSLILVSSACTSLAQDGTNDGAFNIGLTGFSNTGTGPNSTVRASVIQSDAKVLIGGDFITYNGTSRNRIVRLNEDGSVDTGFDPGTGANSIIRHLSLQTDGKILVSGDFVTFNSVAKIALIRLNTDGSIDTGFDTGTGPNGGVYKAMQITGGKILIVGAFTTYNGVARNRIAQLNADGSLDTTFDPGTGANNTILEVHVQQDGKFVIGGNFTTYNGTARQFIARLNTDGILDTGFDASTAPSSTVHTIVSQSNGKLVIGGNFVAYNGTTKNYLVRLNTDGSHDNSFVGTGALGRVNASVVQPDDKVVIVGEFSTYNGVMRSRIARLNADGSLDLSFNGSADNAVNTVSLHTNGELVIGGAFLNYNSFQRRLVTRVTDDGSFDAGGVGATSNVRKITIQSDGKILVTGEFTGFDGKLANRIVRLSASGVIDPGFVTGSGASTVIRDVATQADQKIIIVGDFATYNGTTRAGIARLNSDGTLDLGFSPGTGANGGIYSVAVQADGKILIAGVFTSYNGTSINRIARLNSDGSLDTSFIVGSGFNSVVRMLARQSDGKVIVVGDFTAYNGQLKTGIARLNTNGAFDAGFAGTGTNLLITAVAIQPDGKVLIGGDFTTVNGITKNKIARLNTDGSVDNSFNLGTGPSLRVNSFATEPDGQIIIGGEFLSVNGTARNRIARLNSDGSLDTFFDPGTGADNSVFSVALQSDGIIMGGSFTNYNGTVRYRIARLTICPAPTVTSITPGSRCGDGTVTLGAMASTGTLNWYAALTGGTSLGTGTSFITPSIAATTTYYVEAFSGGCTSARTAVTASVNSMPTITSTLPASRCDTGTIVLTAAASAGTLNWYSGSTGGASLGAGTSFTTPSIANTTTYFVDATNAGCTSARTAIVATVNTTPSVTATAPAGRCDTGTVTLGATASVGTLTWYAVSAGGLSIGSGASYTTPSISTTTTYYVDASSGACTSLRTAVIATVSTTPTVTNATPASRCNSGIVQLGATASAGTLNWYATSSGGPTLGTGVNFTSPSIAVTTTYYVEASSNGCTSARTAVVATVNTTPSVTTSSPGTRCDTGSVVLGATANAGVLNWYTTSTGGSSIGTGISYTTPSLALSTTFYVDATNNGCTTTRTAIAATINTTPSITNTTPGGRCDTGTIVLNANSSAGTINWYSATTGGSSLGTGTLFTTPSISSTITYFVEATNTGCTSSRTAVTASINPVPVVTGTTPGQRCDAGPVTLAASASAGTLNWYGASSGGAILGSAINFTTPSLASTTTFFVEANNGGCTSARTSVLATVNTTPSVTTTTPGVVGTCDSGSATLGATASAGILNWYASSSGGTSLGAGPSFITPNLTSSTTYYVDATYNGCTSARSAVVATIKATPSITSTSLASRCDAGTLVLGATVSAGSLSWFSASSGGVSLGTGTSFTTPNINTTTTYYAEATANGCTSARTSVIATVTATPVVTNTIPGSRCDTGSVLLGAAVSDGTLDWFAATTGGTLLGSGTSFASPDINATTTFYVEGKNNGCVSLRSAVPATVNTSPTITSITDATVSTCGGGSATLQASASAGILNWYNNANSGTTLGTGSAFTTPMLASTTTYFVEATHNGCTSSRTAVLATVNSAPVITSTTPGSRCEVGVVGLIAEASSGTLNWFAEISGGAALGTGMSFITPSLLSTTTYYVEAVDKGCVSTRTAVSATINITPVVGASLPRERCGPGTLVLEASSNVGTLNWYADPTNGTLLSSGSSFTTPTLETTTIYYVAATHNECTSARTAVLATVNQAPTIISTTSGTASTCDAGTVTLSAAASAGTIDWYAAATGGTSLGVGTNFTTTSLASSTTYFVEATEGVCVSARAAVNAFINASPTKPVISANNTNPAAPLLVSSAATGNQWFKDGVPISQATASTLTIQEAGIYTVQVSLLGCVSPRSAEYSYVITSVEPEASNPLTLFPNPAIDELMIDLSGFDKNACVQILITDLSGHVLYRISVDSKQKVHLDVSHFSSGPYAVMMTQDGRKLIKRFIKQ